MVFTLPALSLLFALPEKVIYSPEALSYMHAYCILVRMAYGSFGIIIVIQRQIFGQPDTDIDTDSNTRERKKLSSIKIVFV